MLRIGMVLVTGLVITRFILSKLLRCICVDGRLTTKPKYMLRMGRMSGNGARVLHRTR